MGDNSLTDCAVLRPLEGEITEWLLETVVHCVHVEYYAAIFNIGLDDPQRPHDIVGFGNKFEWDIIKQLSLQYRNSEKEFFKKQVFPGIELHRNQYHHKNWNYNNGDLPYSKDIATSEDLLFGALDSICSLREERRMYQGGFHHDNEIFDIIGDNPSTSRTYMREIFFKVLGAKPPSTHLIDSVFWFPNVGLPSDVHKKIVERVDETITMLREEQHYFKNLRSANIIYFNR
ncbi:hypothetical protein HOK51_00435 [Candidatus Woesearchaeota archaeon]|jgi:hypothetical protein|nr:hypothetical protein [Candidatus Woesearchaeota archaeon]MBT6518280.1 hypothetical protein [Candidatus Woesearchaeota archaeon]MBT7367063.1 hypothetical protein [Candidatus Woesearchaeota archaeon]